MAVADTTRPPEDVWFIPVGMLARSANGEAWLRTAPDQYVKVERYVAFDPYSSDNPRKVERR